jgi:hypothetical protein
MRILEVPVFLFQELSATAKENARMRYRAHSPEQDWCDHIIADFDQVCRLLGVELSTRSVRLLGGGTRQEPKIHFSGFGCQGDGASFEGFYRYRPGAVRAIKEFAPQDAKLLRIAAALQGLQRRHFYRLEAAIGSRGRECHEYTMTFDVYRSGAEVHCAIAADLMEILRDLARWLFGQLQAEWEYLSGDDFIDGELIDGGYEFTEDGARM